MAISNAALDAKLSRIEALLVQVLAQTAAPVATAAPVVATAATTTVPAEAALARPYFAATGAMLRTLSEAGDIAAIAEVAFRAAKRAAK